MTIIKNIYFYFYSYTLYLQIYNLFMLFWLVNFVIALGELTLAGAFASYYWAFDKNKDIPSFPLLFSFLRCFRYVIIHLSLLFSLCKCFSNMSELCAHFPSVDILGMSELCAQMQMFQASVNIIYPLSLCRYFRYVSDLCNHSVNI